MAVWSEVNKSILGKYFGRIDAEFYRPINLFAINRVESVPHCNFGQLVKEGYRVVYGNTKILKQEENNEKTCRFLQATNISNDGMLIECDKVGHVSECDWNRYPKGRIKHGEILIEVKGQAEKVTIVPDDYPLRTLVSGSVYKASLKNDILTPEYVYAFFQSSTGKMLRDRTKTNTLISFVSKPELYSIPIPLFTKSDTIFITDLIKSALRKNKLSQSLYTQAQELLERELGLDKLVFDKPLSYEARLSEVVGNNRADAECYQPMYLNLRTLVRNYKHGFSKLTDIAFSLPPNIDPGKFANTEFEYVELSSINPSLGIIGKGTKLLGKEAPSRARRKLETGDILASAVVGSVDKAAIVDSSSNGKLASTGFFQFRPKQIKSEYLLILVRSKLITMQLQQEATGGILSAVPDNRLHNVIIPTLPDDLQCEISDLVYKSHKLFHKSQQLLEQAKQRVEELIEQAVQ